jgi:hypothetical protein
MLTLQAVAEIMPLVDQHVPTRGWVDLNEIYTIAVVDKGHTCSIVRFGELMKMAGLYVRESKKNPDRWQFEVSRTCRERVSEPTPLYRFRRTFMHFLEDQIKEGEQYIAQDVYDAFRRSVRDPALSAGTLGRALQGSPFTTVTKRLNGVCTRVILRRVDLSAENEARARERAERAQAIAEVRAGTRVELSAAYEVLGA